ncbi:MAG: hypothetical protein WA945_09945 [Arcobacteraceae bacterium]
MNFKEQLEEDLSIFYNNEEFATTALHNENEITVIFDEAYEVESSKNKSITVRSSEGEAIEDGDRLEIEGITYTVQISEYKDDTNLEMIIGIWSE